MICFSVYLNKHLKLYVTIFVSDNFFVNKIYNESFLIFEIQKFNACAEPRVEISTQDGRLGYLSLILYQWEGTSLYDATLVIMLKKAQGMAVVCVCVCGGGG